MSHSPVDLRTLASNAPVHFMGVGGAGMCPLAELLFRHGGQVTGCDRSESRSVADLESVGIACEIGHDASHVRGISALVVTAAIPADHPEIEAARVEGIPVLKRAEALGAWVNEGRLLAVAGTHGKTTTTAMATEILAAADLDPTGLVGGRVQGWNGNLRYGADDLFVVEADEYDRSFHTLRPDVAIVTNLEADHLEIYGDLDGVRDGFRVFLDGMKPGGTVAVCADDSGASLLLPELGAHGLTYGTNAGAMVRGVDVEVRDGVTRCRIMERGVNAGMFEVPIGGVHNLRNALGAAAAARVLGVEWDAIRRGLAAFRGVGRRFEKLGESAGVLVIDDYAHHPTEIAAALVAARDGYPGRRVVAAFQPHLYSRTRDFRDEFGQALSLADEVWVTDVFPAREPPIPGVDGSMIADAVRVTGDAVVHYEPSLAELPHVVADSLGGGDLLITLGAGSIGAVGSQVLAALGARIHA